jgi:hypothetical protein
MISKVKELQLIRIYLYICDIYDKELKYVCERFSNNFSPCFTDQEIITIYLFSMHSEQKYKIKHIYDFAKGYLFSWFPKLPSYVAFDTRLNRLSEALKAISAKLFDELKPADCSTTESLLDSMPIITCSGKRVGKVANELTDKGFCSTKNMYYYGAKLHALGLFRPSKLPFPEQFVITPASENDLNVFKQNWANIPNRKFYGDKIYFDHEYFAWLATEMNSYMLTPVKVVKAQADSIKHFDKAANDLYSTGVSKVRQPIESLFNWLIEKTDIQRASKVRSANGLLVHIFGHIAAAYIFLIFNS